MSRTIIHSAVVFDGVTVHPPSTVVFNSESGFIESFSQGKNAPEASANDTVIDGTGCTLMPGLIDSHIHFQRMSYAPEHEEEYMNLLKANLKCGVTTVCDMHSDPEAVNLFRTQVKDDLAQAKLAGAEGRVTRADVKSCVYAATIEKGWPRPIVLGSNPHEKLRAKVAQWPNVTEKTAAEYIAAQKERGADYIKIMQEDGCAIHHRLPIHDMNVATESLQGCLIEAAHAADFKVVAHALSLDNTALVLRAGVDGLAHTFMDQTPTREVIDLYKKTNAFVIPTLVAIAAITGEEDGMREKFASIGHNKGLLNEDQTKRMMSSIGVAAEKSSIEHAYESIRQLQAAGIDVVAGTDSLCGHHGSSMGVSMWMEMDRYVQKCNMTALEVLCSAAGVPARRFGFDDRGIVETGRKADLLLVKGNPHEGLDALWADDAFVGIWKNGFRAA